MGLGVSVLLGVVAAGVWFVTKFIEVAHQQFDASTSLLAHQAAGHELARVIEHGEPWPESIEALDQRVQAYAAANGGRGGVPGGEPLGHFVVLLPIDEVNPDADVGEPGFPLRSLNLRLDIAQDYGGNVLKSVIDEHPEYFATRR